MSTLPRLAACCLLACTGGTTPGEVSVQLGTGEVAFEALVDDQEVPLVAGSQGGHHVWLSFRAEGVSSDRVLLDVDAVVLDESEPPPSREPVRIRLSELDDGSREYIGWPAQLVEPECLVGKRLSVRITLTDSSGAECTDERIVIPQSNPILGECER